MKYCVANWKMNLNIAESIDFIENLSKKNLQNKTTTIILSPSFTSLNDVSKSLKKTRIELGAQNVNSNTHGSYTGEISVAMLKEFECDWVILGHSERRQYYNEEDVILNDKLNTVLTNGLNPILCIGESFDQRKNNETFPILKHQLDIALNNLEIGNNKILLAYEPVWAIGTGLAATTDIISEVINYLKEYLMQNFSLNIPILYGGSVSKENSSAIIDIKGVDGFLIGSSSLDVTEFYNIYLNMIER